LAELLGKVFLKDDLFLEGGASFIEQTNNSTYFSEVYGICKTMISVLDNAVGW
jgi:hypothetical protein